MRHLILSALERMGYALLKSNDLALLHQEIASLRSAVQHQQEEIDALALRSRPLQITHADLTEEIIDEPDTEVETLLASHGLVELRDIVKHQRLIMRG